MNAINFFAKGARTVVVRIINMLPDKLVMAGIIVLIFRSPTTIPLPPLYIIKRNKVFLAGTPLFANTE